MNYQTLSIGALLLISTLKVFAANTGVPALSVTAPNGQESILIGSLHSRIEGLRQPDISIFNNTKRFVIEHDDVDFKPTPLPTLPVWAQGLTKDEYKIYIERVNCYGYSNEIAFGTLFLPTTQVANVLAYTVCENPRIQSRDEWIKSLKPSQLQTDVLEDADWAESQRILVGADNDNTGLKWILARDPKTVLVSIRDHLNNGNYGPILESSTVPIGDANTVNKFKDIMVTGRNKAWMPKLKQYLDDGKAVILVGAAHLPGEKGLINLLESDGYSVKAIMLPEASQ